MWRRKVSVEVMSTTRSASDSERWLASFWSSYHDSKDRGAVYLVRHPVQFARVLSAIARLPVLRARPSATAAGKAVRATLTLKGPLGTPARWLGSAVLVVPQPPSSHLEGRAAQTLRRKIRSAEKLGVTCVLVDDAEERRSLLELANAAEQNHHNPRYRVATPDNQDLLRHDVWLKAVDSNGAPLLLAVIPCDGEYGTLRYFRTLGSSIAHSDSRYLATYALVQELAGRGVRYLLDTEAPGAQTNGLRHFQRMVGFRYFRVRLER
jgi:hypothetical protein